MPVLTHPLVRNPGHELAQHDQVDDDASSQQAVFADVVADEGVLASHEDLARILVNGLLRVSSVGHVLDHDSVVGVLLGVPGVVEERVIEEVLDAFRLGGLFGFELPFGSQVLAVVVAEMVVGDAGLGLDACAGEEVNEGSFELGLARLEVVADEETWERSVLDALDEGVLRGPVDEDAVLLEGGQGEDGGGCDFGVVGLDGLDEVLVVIVDAFYFEGEPFGVGSPEHDDCVEVVLLLEGSNVVADLLQMSVLVVPGNQVVSPVLLVGSDEVGVVDRLHRLVLLHEGLQLVLQLQVEHLGPVHGLREVHRVDVPASHHQVGGVHHGDHLVEPHVKLAVGGVSHLHGRALGHGAQHVGVLDTLFGIPGHLFPVGDDAAQDGGAVVASKSDHHEADFADVFGGLELVMDVVNFGSDALGGGGGRHAPVHVLGSDELFGMLDSFGFDVQTHLFFNLSRINRIRHLLQLFENMSPLKLYIATFKLKPFTLRTHPNNTHTRSRLCQTARSLAMLPYPTIKAKQRSKNQVSASIGSETIQPEIFQCFSQVVKTRSGVYSCEIVQIFYPPCCFYYLSAYSRKAATVPSPTSSLISASTYPAQCARSPAFMSARLSCSYRLTQACW